MDTMINSDLVKQLRLERAWSQEKLAAVSGLSLRTIQRIEKGGTCSLETKTSLAAVFQLSPEQLTNQVQAVKQQKPAISGVLYGYLGAGIGLICSYAGITYSVIEGTISLGEAGMYYGIVGAMVGISCGLIGYLGNREKLA